jgi:hypothetical protein
MCTGPAGPAGSAPLRLGAAAGRRAGMAWDASFA